MKNTKKRRAMDLLYFVAQRRGRRNSDDGGSAGLGRAARTAVIAAEAAALLSMVRRMRSGRGRRVLPIVAAVYLARHIGTKPPQSS